MVAEQVDLKQLVTQERWEALYSIAHKTGDEAATRTTPRTMVVQQRANPFDDNSEVQQEWVVPEGPCGFAWVNLRPATHKFVRWTKSKGYSSAAYGGGHQIWVSAYNQSMDRKYAYAAAFSKVLQEAFADQKLRIYPESRYD